MFFNDLNSVEHYIIHQLSGVNLNVGIFIKFIVEFNR